MAAHELISSLSAVSGVPVFMYHDVCAGPATKDRYTTCPWRDSANILSFLSEHGFAVEDLPALTNDCGRRNVVLTFDDGLVESLRACVSGSA